MGRLEEICCTLSSSPGIVTDARVSVAFRSERMSWLFPLERLLSFLTDSAHLLGGIPQAPLASQHVRDHRAVPLARSAWRAAPLHVQHPAEKLPEAFAE